MNPPQVTGKFDAEVKNAARQKFVDLAERLATAGTVSGQAAAWAHASSIHPDGKKWFKTWQDQIQLERQEMLARDQALRGGTAMGNQKPTLPVKNPRSAALVGLTMDASDAEFLSKWKDRFPDQGLRVNAPESFGTTGAPPASHDLSAEETAKAAFIAETQRLIAAGHNYQDAWQIAMTTEPGRAYYRKWQAGATAEKQIFQ